MKYHIDPNKIVWRNIDGDVVILNLDSGVYYNLNKTGSLIWCLLDKQRSTEEIIERICERYRIAPEKASRDILAVIEDLKKESLIASDNKS